MEMKKHYPISLSLVGNHIKTVEEIVNVETTNCGTGLDVARLKGKSTCRVVAARLRFNNNNNNYLKHHSFTRNRTEKV